MNGDQPVVWIVECPCGYEIREPTQDEAASHVQRHGEEVHGAQITREEALAMTRPQEGPKQE